MRMDFKVRDPIYGYIPFTRLEQRLIDTVLFQRLRGLKQLSNADLAYPGATHTRFSHSLGTMHLAYLMGKHLSLEEDSIKYVRIAALLHDIGHPPHSHVFEDAINSLGYPFDHETQTINLLSTKNELTKILDSGSIEMVKDVLNGENSSIEHDIITSSIDADKMDYLLRDSYYCGVKYGNFDLDRILFCLDKIEDGDKQNICISINGVNAIDNLRLARYQMHKQVYQHKVRLACDCMIKRAIELCLKNDLEFSKEMPSILNLSDIEFESILSNSQSEISATIINMIRRRELLKVALDLPLRNLPSVNHRYILAQKEIRKDLLNEFETDVAKLSKTNKNLVIATIVEGTPLDKKMSHKRETPLLVKDPCYREPKEFTNYSSISQTEKNEPDRLVIFVPGRARELLRKIGDNEIIKNL